MTAKKQALAVNKNLKSKRVGMRWQIFDGDKPYASDGYSAQTAWYNAKIVALCPFKVGDTLRRVKDDKLFTVIANATIGCVSHLHDSQGVFLGLYEWQYPDYEIVKTNN